MAGKQEFNQINITPLTDIFLVLLIIMMVVAPLLDQQGLNLTVPELVKEEQINESKILTVFVTNDGKYFINNQEISTESLGDAIKSQISQNPDGLLIQSEPDATHGSVVKVMDIARNVGVKSISIGNAE